MTRPSKPVASAIVQGIVEGLHVTTSDRGVIRIVRGRFRKGLRRAASHRAARKDVYRYALEVHRENRLLYEGIQSGI